MLIDIPPMAHGESLAGYFLRLADVNGVPGIRALLAPARVLPRSSYTEAQIGSIADALHLDESALRGANPRAGRAEPAYNPLFQPGRRLAVCPSCIAEQGHHRAAWSSSLTPVCVRHRAVLVDQCPDCGQHLTIDRPSVRYCVCGLDLAKAKAEPAPSFSTAVASLLTSEPARPELQDQLPDPLWRLGSAEADEFMWWLACHAADPGGRKAGKRSRPASSAESLYVLESFLAPILAEWPQGLRRLLAAIDERVDENSAGTGKALGRWYRDLYKRFGEARFAWLHDEVASYVAAEMATSVNGRTTRIPKELSRIKGWLSVAEAARVIGVSPERLRLALREEQLEGKVRTAGASRDLMFVRRETVDELAVLRESFVDARTAMKLLQVTKGQLERLVTAGAVTRFDSAHRPALVDSPFRADELKGLLRTLENRCVTRDVPLARQATLDSLVVVRGRGEALVMRIFRAIASGELVPRGLLDRETGLRRFVFDWDEALAVGAHDEKDTQLTLSQVAEITGWKPEAITAWVRAGLLPALRTPNGASSTTWIRVDDLLVFTTTHVVLADLAGACASRSRHVADRLRAEGCELKQFSNSEGVAFASLVHFADLGGLILRRAGP